MIIRILLVIAVFCLIAKSTLGEARGNEFIAGGNVALAVVGQFPSFVIVHLPSGVQPNNLCGGILLNSNHVVTSGSCVLDSNNHLIAPGTVTVRMGVINLQGTPPLFLVDRIFVHPLYNPWTFDNDIAVLRTVAQVTIPETINPAIRPAEFNDRIIQDGGVCVFVGLNSASQLSFITQNIMPRTSCNSRQLRRNNIAQSQFCAGGNEPAGPCTINRGGPLFCNGRVAGILSNGFSCGVLQNVPGVYTQIRMYLPWINQQLTRNDLTPAGSTPPPTFPLLSGQAAIISYMSLIAISLLGVMIA